MKSISFDGFISLPVLDSGVSMGGGFFSRKGGVSKGIYDSLNVGLGSKDDQNHVLENRDRIRRAVGADSLVTCHQIHSNTVITVTQPWTNENAPQADGLVTNQKGIALGVLTADCCPVLFRDEKNQIIGATHAGWKGAMSGILEKTVQAMCDLGSSVETIQAFIGPCIHQSSYEVDSGFYDRFIQQSPNNETFFKPSLKQGHFMFNLPEYACGQLKKTGINVTLSLSKCTYENKDLYFSFRRTTHRNESDYGRQMAVLTLF